MTRNYSRFLRIAVVIVASAVAALLVSPRSASAAPAITSISPTTCSTAGGTVVTITGTGFVGTPTVTFGVGFPDASVVTAPNVTFVSNTTITVIAPARAARNWAVEVTNPGGQSVSIDPGCTYAFIAPTSTGVRVANDNPQSNYSFPMACVNGKSIFGRSPTKKLIERGGSFSSSTLTASTTNSGLQTYESTVSIKGDSNQAAQPFWLTQDTPNYAVLQSVDSLSDLDICDGPRCPLKVLTAFSYQVLTASEMRTAEALQTGPVASASSPVATLNSSTIVKNVTMTVTGLSLDKPGSFIGLRRWTENNWTLLDGTVVRNSTDIPMMGLTLSTTASAKLPFGVYAVVYSDPECNSATPLTGAGRSTTAGDTSTGTPPTTPPTGTLPTGVMTPLVPAAVPAPSKSGTAGLTVSSSSPVLVAVLAVFAATVVASARIATRRKHR